MKTTRLDISLVGYEVGLSGAVPDRHDWTEPAMDRGILEFVALITSLVVKYGGRIIHGAHPTFTPVILGHARQHSVGRNSKPVTLVMSELWSKGYSTDELNLLSETAEIVVTPQVGPGGPEETDTRNRSLRRMRYTLIQQMNVMVAVGGKLHAADGKVPGVVEEMDLARQRGLPCFLVGGLGGMAADYAKGLDASAALKNDLSREQNDQLFDTDDVATTVSVIFDKLAFGQSLLRRKLTDLSLSEEAVDVGEIDEIDDDLKEPPLELS